MLTEGSPALRADAVADPRVGRAAVSGEEDLVARLSRLEAFSHLLCHDLVDDGREAIDRSVDGIWRAQVERHPADKARLDADNFVGPNHLDLKAPEARRSVRERDTDRLRGDDVLDVVNDDGERGVRSGDPPDYRALATVDRDRARGGPRYCWCGGEVG
jgi:hypothetical protein